MPIRPENKHRYPKDWALRSRFVREVRAKGRCEWCGIRNYSVGYRDRAGRFIPLAGNGPCDFAGQGLAWPSFTPITYQEAQEFVEVCNCCIANNGRRCDDQGNHYFAVRLTVAHVFDDRPEASSLLNLAALCERCHNRHDAKRRLRDRRLRAMDGPSLFAV